MKKIMKKVAAMKSMKAKSTRHEKCEAAAEAKACAQFAMNSMKAEAAALKSMVMKLDENLLVLRDAVAGLQDAVAVLQDAVVVLQGRRIMNQYEEKHKKEHEDHAKKLEKFWVDVYPPESTSVGGQYHLEKPEKLRKKCEAQLEAAKKKKEVVEQ